MRRNTSIQNRRRHAIRRRRPGVVIVLVVMMLVVLLGVAALSVDGGRMYFEKRNVQTVADLAAEAAGIELASKFATNAGADVDGMAQRSALAIASLNGYGNDVRSTVVVNIPPKSGPNQGKLGYAETIVTSTLGRSFSSVFGTGDLAVVARAVAAGTKVVTKGSVLTLDPKRKDSLKLKGKSTTLSVVGDIFVNSNSKDAVKVDKKSQIHADMLFVTGRVGRKSKGLIDASVETGVDPQADPLAGLTPPEETKVLDVKKFMKSVNGNDVYELQPGTYKEFKFDKRVQVQLDPGIYVVQNGVQIRNDAQFIAYEVMIYNAGKKGFKIDTTGEVLITPPKAGPYRGVSLFQSTATKSKVEFKKSGALNIDGVIYAPNSEVKFRHSNITMDDTDEAYEEAEEDEEVEYMDDDGGISSSTVFGASIISRRLSIDKGSQVQINGAHFDAWMTLRGLVE